MTIHVCRCLAEPLSALDDICASHARELRRIQRYWHYLHPCHPSQARATAVLRVDVVMDQGQIEQRRRSRLIPQPRNAYVARSSSVRMFYPARLNACGLLACLLTAPGARVRGATCGTHMRLGRRCSTRPARDRIAVRVCRSPLTASAEAPNTSPARIHKDRHQGSDVSHN